MTAVRSARLRPWARCALPLVDALPELMTPASAALGVPALTEPGEGGQGLASESTISGVSGRPPKGRLRWFSWRSPARDGRVIGFPDDNRPFACVRGPAPQADAGLARRGGAG